MRDFRRAEPSVAVPFDRSVARHTHQTHCIVGSRACGIDDARRLPLALAVNLLGGPSANSLLNVVLREKHGLSYNIEGILYALYRLRHRRRVLQLRPCQHGAVSRPGGAGAAPALHRAPDPAPSGDGQATVHRTARHFDGEQRGVYARHLGKSFLLHDRVDTMEEVYAKIGALTASDLTAAAEEVFGRTPRLIYK